MRRRFFEFGNRLFGRKHSQRRSNKHGSILRHAAFARRLRCEVLEDRRLLSVGQIWEQVAAVDYANTWVYGRNTARYNDYPYDPVTKTGGDCANYVSQCLIAGGLNLEEGVTDSYGAIPSCDNLHTYLTGLSGSPVFGGTEVKYRHETEPLWFLPGDVAIFGDNSGDDWVHAVIAVSGDSTHYAECASHTIDGIYSISDFFNANAAWTQCTYYDLRDHAEAPSTEFASGDELRTTVAGVNMRTGPSFGEPKVAGVPDGMPFGATVQVLSDPSNGRAYNGHYWWKVQYQAYQGWCAGDWFEKTIEIDDNYEPNNSLATAYDLSSDEQTWLQTINDYGIQRDDDWYKIYVTPGYEQVLVDCRFTDADGDIDIALYDASGTYLDSSVSTTDNEYIDYVVSGGGTYYIKVYYGDAGNSYDLWWDDIIPPNQAPVADAGGPYSVDEGSTVTLNASGSYDPDGSIVSYLWDLDNDEQYDDASGVTASFSRTADGTYTVGVKVTDDDGAEDTDTATVTVNNVAPTADAGGPYEGEQGSLIPLSAAGSTDPGNDIVSYEWDLDNDGQYDDASGVTVNYNANAYGVFTVAVRVTDDDGAWDVDSAQVTVLAANPYPGDANRDGTVGQADSLIVSGNWLMQTGATWAHGDFNGDHRVDDLDAALMAANWGLTLPPATSSSAATEPVVETLVAAPAVPYDLDNNGKIDLADLAFFAPVYRERPGITTESPCAYAADFDRSGMVDLGDLAFFAANFRLGRPNDSIAYPAEVSQSSSAAPKTATAAATSMVAVDDLDATILAWHWMMSVEDMDDDEDDARDLIFATIGAWDDALEL